MKTKIAVLGGIAALVLFAGACSAALGTPKQTTMEVSYDQMAEQKNISQEINVPQGSKIVIELPANATTGFSWTDAVISDPAVLEQNETKYVAPDGDVVGAPGTQVWTFTATAKGTATVKMEYSRPWEGGEKAEWTYQLNITVQ